MMRTQKCYILTDATPQQRIQDYAKVVRTLRFPQLARFHAHAKDEIFGSDVSASEGRHFLHKSFSGGALDWRFEFPGYCREQCRLERSGKDYRENI